ncbi:MAG: YihA family ribosome biogenesis GTP-binding protein [Clostridia bacterium]|nr:YihA family ribosome biogenesis GTP-binding protein [Clostridia bacterium]
MKPVNLQNAEFVTSAATPEGILGDGLPAIVFAGRSNAGKSSVINKLLNRNKLAFVSKKPGKTIHINYFLIDKRIYLADLPGYGFAKVSDAEKRRWANLIDTFLNSAKNLRIAVVIVDIRHEPTEDDLLMGEFFAAKGIPYIVLCNKCDKLRPREIAPAVEHMREAFAEFSPRDCVAFSALNGTGKDELIRHLFSEDKENEEQ